MIQFGAKKAQIYWRLANLISLFRNQAYITSIKISHTLPLKRSFRTQILYPYLKHNGNKCPVCVSWYLTLSYTSFLDIYYDPSATLVDTTAPGKYVQYLHQQDNHRLPPQGLGTSPEHSAVRILQSCKPLSCGILTVRYSPHVVFPSHYLYRTSTRDVQIVDEAQRGLENVHVQGVVACEEGDKKNTHGKSPDMPKSVAISHGFLNKFTLLDLLPRSSSSL